MSLEIIILAAGQGTRMKSKLPKVLHQVSGMAMIDHVVEEASFLTSSKPVVVIGHQAELVAAHLGDRVNTVLQEKQLGTGHAVMMAEDYIGDEDYVMVLSGDTPLIEYDTLAEMLQMAQESDYGAVVMSTILENPTGYGRILRDSKGLFQKIKEQKDASPEELVIQEVNAGMYIFKGGLLKKNLNKLDSNNAQNEYYLTDILELILRDGQDIGVYQADAIGTMGVNDRMQLAKAEKLMRKRINEKWMVSGVTIIDPDNTYIEKSVTIEPDTVIYPGCAIRGKSIIGENCIIKDGAVIENSVIGDFVTIKSSTMIEAIVGDESTVGPYAYLRPKAVLGNNVKIGDFVEVKNAYIGDHSKASHLSYIGDAEIGQHVNIGCGVVFVNYDGKNKNKSIVKDRGFIGSNVNLVAPVVVEEGGYIATGSTVTVDVPADSLCIARAREVIKKGWRLKKDI